MLPKFFMILLNFIVRCLTDQCGQYKSNSRSHTSVPNPPPHTETDPGNFPQNMPYTSRSVPMVGEICFFSLQSCRAIIVPFESNKLGGGLNIKWLIRVRITPKLLLLIFGWWVFSIFKNENLVSHLFPFPPCVIYICKTY